MSSEQESRLYFGAQRGARSGTQSFSKLSTDPGIQELIDLGIPLESSRREESYEERKRQIDMEIRQKELELAELNALHGERSLLRPQTSSPGLTSEQLQEVVQNSGASTHWWLCSNGQSTRTAFNRYSSAF